MQIEVKENSGLFSSTDIPDIFFSDYLPLASSDAVKVYLYINFLAKNGKDINVNEIAKLLSLSYDVVNSSIKYWEEQGLLIKKVDGYLMANLQEIQLNKLYSPKVTSSPELIEKTAQSKARAAAIESINNQIFSGVMSPSWYTDINLWFDKYGFDEQVMLALFCQCADRNALNTNYVQTVAASWNAEKIKTYEDLEKYFARKDTLNKLGKEITNKLGIRRSLTTFEEEYVLKWTEEYKYNMDIIEIALKRSVLKANAGFKYYDELLTSWYSKGLTKPEEVEKYLESLSEKKFRTKQVQNVVRQYEFTQSTFDSFENLYDN
ncbi:MAG: DnaD domain protein [Clostridia bacterium]|nr:DnaD domain protein [Clostridia bacterium]